MYLKKVFKILVKEIKKSLEYDSEKLVYVASIYFVLVLVLYWFTKSRIVSVVLFMAAIAYFGVRYICRIDKNYSGIKIQGYKIDYSENQKTQANKIGDAGLIIFFIMSALFMFEDINGDFFGYVIGILMVDLLFCGFAYYSVSKNLIVLKLATILLSTIRGTFLLGYLVVIVVSLGQSTILFVEGNTDTFMLDSIPNLKLGIAKAILYVSLFIEEFPLLTIVELVMASFLLIIYIKVTPPYQLAKLQTSFQIINIFVIIIGVVALLLADDMFSYIVTERENLSELNVYMDGLSAGSIRTVFSILVLPYSFSLSLINVAIQNRRERIKRKTDNILEKLTKLRDVNSEEIQRLQSEYCFYAGDKHLWRIYFKEYVEGKRQDMKI